MDTILYKCRFYDFATIKVYTELNLLKLKHFFLNKVLFDYIYLSPSSHTLSIVDYASYENSLCTFFLAPLENLSICSLHTCHSEVSCWGFPPNWSRVLRNSARGTLNRFSKFGKMGRGKPILTSKSNQWICSSAYCLS